MVIAMVAVQGAITSALGFALSTWCVQRGGPFLATAYIPTQAVFSAVFGLIFLGDVVYLGRCSAQTYTYTPPFVVPSQVLVCPPPLSVFPTD